MNRPAAALVAVVLVCSATVNAFAQESGWFPLQVPGGRGTLSSLDVLESRERAAVMIDLIRRLHFSTDAPAALTKALQSLMASPRSGPAIDLPSPLPAALWSTAVFRRSIAGDRLFAEILTDRNARLLFHGLAGMDADTRAWINQQPDLLRGLYRDDDAVSAFALFAPAIVVRNGHVVIPGGEAGAQRWSSALNVDPERAPQFVARLFEDRAGRSAGLYFLISYTTAERQRFILGSAGAFTDLLDSFAGCYPSHSNTYPFVLRSHDAALLLLDVALDADGGLAGPSDGEVWNAVFDGDDIKSLDAASMTRALCGATSDDRRDVFETLLAAQRVFAPYDASRRDSVIAALRGRRAYPSLFVAVEQAGIRQPEVYASLMRHADRVGAVDDPARAITAARLFQGAIALTTNARLARTLSVDEAQLLLTQLASVPFRDDRYDGRIADWLEQWLAIVRRNHPALATASIEQTVAFALAGPSASSNPRVTWDGEEYVLDVRGAIERRLLEVRKRQGGVTLDTAMQVRALGPGIATDVARSALAFTPADEYGGDIVTAAALRDSRHTGRVVDYLLAHALASWTYAPHVGDPDGGAMVAGDGSLRHQLGVRLNGRARREQRWRVAPPPARGVVAGSLLALEAPLATWSLRRLSAMAMPPRRQIGGNDLMSLMLTAALVDGRRLQDDELSGIAVSIARGAARVTDAVAQPSTLMSIGGEGGMSPWRVAVLPWMAEHEPDRVTEQFSLATIARAGGLGNDGALAPWGTANIVTGCLCVEFPAIRIPELTLGRAADGIVGAQSSDLMLRIAMLLSEMKLPGALAAAVLTYAMRDFLDHVQPGHPADFEAFERQARTLSRRHLEDYLSAIVTVGPLRPVSPQ